MKRLRSSAWFGLVGLCVVVGVSAGACAKNNSGGTGGDVGSGGSGGASASSGSGGEGGILIPVTSVGSGTGGAGGEACDEGLSDTDNDGDGFTELEGDCNDCDKFVNPNAVEVVAEPDGMGNTPPPSDENCNGFVDEPAEACDSGLVLNSENPEDAVKAVGICKFMKSAKWVIADGTPPPADALKLANFHLGHGILPKFGTNNAPQEGSSMLMLSSGTAREQGHPESFPRSFDKTYTSNPPYGFPKESPSCPAIITGLPHDATGLQIEVDVPSNALSVSFDFQFFTYEWSDFICTEYNDFFVAHVEPFPMGQGDGNIAFDALGNPISVNSAFIGACGCPGNPPGNCVASGFTFKCALGKGPLIGTPFEKDEFNEPGWTHGSTGWLRTTTAVTPGGSFRIRFVTYDSKDGNADSSTLIDNWRWSGKPGTTYTEPVPPK
jgi:hypothetical protein